MSEGVYPSRLVRFLAFSAVAIWFGFIGLFFHYDATRPTIPQPNQARVYPSNNHGHVVYLSALVAKGMRPEMARLTLARKIATIVLIVWKKGVCFDANHLKPQTA